MNKRITKRESRKLRQQGVLNSDNEINTKNFTLRNDIKPLTENQKLAFENWFTDYNLFLHGVAGTGKTFIALYLALNDVMRSDTDFETVHILRSTVSTRDQGFMPGSQKQKEAVYEEPYPPICKDLFGREDSYPILKQKGLIDFRTTSFLRGVTFENSVLVVDEVQNMSEGELHTVMTRIGNNTRVIFCGDIRQDDLTSKRFNEESGVKDFMKVISSMSEFSFVEFDIDDIVRSALVKSYIIAKIELGL